MSSDLQHINTTVLMGIVGPSHSVVILYMNQTWCWTPAIAVLTLSWDLQSCAAQSISWLYGTTPAGLQSLLLVLSISCASRWAHAPIIQQWVCRFVIADADRQRCTDYAAVWISFSWLGFETCFPSSPSLISLFILVCWVNTEDRKGIRFSRFVPVSSRSVTGMFEFLKMCIYLIFKGMKEYWG